MGFKLIRSYFLMILFVSGCEENINVDLPRGEQQIVVEGHIENDSPPYVILTRSSPYFSSTDIQALENAFVHDAEITVYNNRGDTIQLKEYASDTLSQGFLNFASSIVGSDLAKLRDSLGVTFYFYADFGFRGRTGETYHLDIQKDNEHLTAVTHLKQTLPLDSVFFKDHPETDSLRLMFVKYSDPAGEPNYVRYFNKINDQPYYPGYFNSVFDDETILAADGKTFNFSLERGYDRNDPPEEFENYAYFNKNDTVTLKWCAIDQAHHAFWRSVEFEIQNQGNPFVRPTVVNTNINGGLGIWGAYSCLYYEKVVE